MKQKSTISAAAFKMIMNFEHFHRYSYKNNFGTWCIGYGCMYHLDGSPIKAGDELASRKDATALLKHNINIYEKAVTAAVNVLVTQSQMDVLVSFALSVGIPRFLSSALLGHLNNGNFQKAADQFLNWVDFTDLPFKIIGNREDQVVTYRRKKERLIFLK
jgi:lysozyme